MNRELLLQRIEEKRKLLRETLKRNNMNLVNENVLKQSKELDKLIAEYTYLLSQSQK